MYVLLQKLSLYFIKYLLLFLTRCYTISIIIVKLIPRVGFMELKEWVVSQTAMGNYACYERVYDHMSGILGVGKSSIRQWVDGQRRISAEHVLNIEKITNGEVTRQQLRADLYPD
jgi:hypothetical protein